MAGWLTLMLIMLVAGREATRELSVFQVMEMRSVIGLFLLAGVVYWALFVYGMPGLKPYLGARPVAAYV